MNPDWHQSNKQRGQDLGWKVHEGANLLFLTHVLCINYVMAMFLLVSCMNTRNHQLYFARFFALSTPKIAKKKPTTMNFARFHNHFPLLTMLKCECKVPFFNFCRWCKAEIRVQFIFYAICSVRWREFPVADWHKPYAFILEFLEHLAIIDVKRFSLIIWDDAWLEKASDRLKCLRVKFVLKRFSVSWWKQFLFIKL